MPIFKGLQFQYSAYCRLSFLRKFVPKNRTVRAILFVCLIGILVFAFCLPSQLFDKPTSTVIFDQSGKLLAASIAKDGQWRFPPNDTIPEKYKKVLLCFEDQYFYYHPGVNPFSMVRAFRQNIRNHKVVSGASTITAQVIRMSRGKDERNYWQKAIECFMALRLEWRYSKDEILALYASNAPFGGNVVGLDAASWRYYGRSPNQLSWAETATLVVLPNAPSLIYPGKGNNKLFAKRNRLLTRLYRKGIIDSVTCVLATGEPLVSVPEALPRVAPHLLDRVVKDGKAGERLITTIDGHLQEQVNRIVEKHHGFLTDNGIDNLAVLVADVNTGQVRAYAGNVLDGNNNSGYQVDMITAQRSSGSTFKPFLYGLMLKEGLLLPQSLVPDVPIQIAGYQPRNFDYKFRGAIHADEALAHSLNIPAVLMLREYGVEKFYMGLKKIGFSTLNQPSNHYGLSIILGGAETTLWDLAGSYASVARMLNNFRSNNSKYDPGNYHPLSYLPGRKSQSKKSLSDFDILGAGSAWCTFEALSQMNRPDEEGDFNQFYSSKKIAWKTGTSFGFRDAWAVGVNPHYVVAVWVGNANGDGRPGLTGASKAAPVMFDVFELLPGSLWFSKPYDDLEKIAVCQQSGDKATDICSPVDSVWVPVSGLKSKPCRYHHLIHLDKSGKNRVTAGCYQVSQMRAETWFVLPPTQEYYYRAVHPFYKPLPAYLSGCQDNELSNIEVIYPQPGTKIFIPVSFGNVRQKIICQAAYRLSSGLLYWHLDEEYLGATADNHQMELYAGIGTHRLTIVDGLGETVTVQFDVVGR